MDRWSLTHVAATDRLDGAAGGWRSTAMISASLWYGAAGQLAWIVYDARSRSDRGACRRSGCSLRRRRTDPLVDDEIWGVMAAGWADPWKLIVGSRRTHWPRVRRACRTAIAKIVEPCELIVVESVVSWRPRTRRGGGSSERDLHDGVQQQLATLALELGTVNWVLPPVEVAARRPRQRLPRGFIVSSTSRAKSPEASIRGLGEWVGSERC